jgi:hypothetical protein
VLGEFRKVIYASESWEGQRKSVILRHGPDPISLVELVDRWAEIFTAGNDAEAVERTSAAVVKQIDSGEETAMVPVTFWATDPDKWPTPFMRRLEAPRWAELSGNYDGNVAKGMDRLGRAIGMSSSTLLRVLANEIRHDSSAPQAMLTSPHSQPSGRQLACAMPLDQPRRATSLSGGDARPSYSSRVPQA